MALAFDFHIFFKQIWGSPNNYHLFMDTKKQLRLNAEQSK